MQLRSCISLRWWIPSNHYCACSIWCGCAHVPQHTCGEQGAVLWSLSPPLCEIEGWTEVPRLVQQMALFTKLFHLPQVSSFSVLQHLTVPPVFFWFLWSWNFWKLQATYSVSSLDLSGVSPKFAFMLCNINANIAKVRLHWIASSWMEQALNLFHH